MKVKFAYGIVPGSESDGKGSRDKIRTVSENGAAVMFLAGSVAGIAAELTAERFDELYASDENFIKEELSGNKRDGALLFVAVKGNRYLAGHMGDGLIVRLDGSSIVLSKPEAEDDERLRIYRGVLQEPFGFMLMSGGACRSLYDSGAGTLSPACGTFFGWLEEYDEEAVSEALADNINKYFLKDGKGDISVGMMVSAEEELAVAEPTEEEIAMEEPTKVETTVDELIEELPSIEEPARESGSRGKIVKYLIAAAIVLAVVFVFAMKPDVAKLNDAAQQENKPPATNSENNVKQPDPESDSSAPPESNEPSVTFSVENPEAYDAGEYQIGEDISAGEYFFWTGEMLQPDSIKVNGETCLSGELYCMTVEVNVGDTLTTDVKFTAAGNVNPVKAINGILISGKYKIGKDIAPGEYRISPMDKSADGKYYSIRGGEISNDEAFGRETTVVVPEAGYIVFYNAVLAVDQK